MEYILTLFDGREKKIDLYQVTPSILFLSCRLIKKIKIIIYFVIIYFITK
jgi:hypothetical protein